MDLVILLGTLFICFAIGMPISYALGFGALVGALWIGIPARSGDAENLRRREQSCDAHHSVLRSGRRDHGGRRYGASPCRFANVIVGVVRIRGGLSAVNILATTFLSGISGSSVADTSAIGSVMIPQMEKVGYPRAFATNVTISASVQAIMVPPEP